MKKKGMSSGEVWSISELNYLKELKLLKIPNKEIVSKLKERFGTNRSMPSLYHKFRIFQDKKTRPRSWKPEEIEFLLENSDSVVSLEEITKQLNLKFNTNRKVESVQNKYLRMNIKRNHWTEEEVEFLRTLVNREKSSKGIAKQLNKEFKRNRSVSSIRSKVLDIGIRKLTPFKQHNYIIRKKLCEDLKLTTHVFENLMKHLKVKPLRQDGNIYIHYEDINYFENFIKKYILVQDACKVLNKNYEVVRSWIRRGKLKNVKIGKYLYLEKNEINEWKKTFDNYISISDLGDSKGYTKSGIRDILKNHKDLDKKMFLNENYYNKNQVNLIFKEKNDKTIWTKNDLDFLHENSDKTLKNLQALFKEKNKIFTLQEIKNKLPTKNKKWSDSELEYLMSLNNNSKITDTDQLINLFNIKFGTSRNKTAILDKLRKISKNKKTGLWSEEELQLLKEVHSKSSSLDEIYETYYLLSNKKRTKKSISNTLKKLNLSQIKLKLWTEKEVEVLKDLNNKKLPLDDLTEEFNKIMLSLCSDYVTRTSDAVSRKLSILGIHKKSKFEWEDSEIELLKNNIGKFQKFIDVKKFMFDNGYDRTKSSIISKASKLKFKLGGEI